MSAVLSRTPGALCSQFGPTSSITLAIVGLYSEACAIVQQSKIQTEVAEGNYDLSALSSMVDPNVASDSETYWELGD